MGLYFWAWNFAERDYVAFDLESLEDIKQNWLGKPEWGNYSLEKKDGDRHCTIEVHLYETDTQRYTEDEQLSAEVWNRLLYYTQDYGMSGEQVLDLLFESLNLNIYQKLQILAHFNENKKEQPTYHYHIKELLSKKDDDSFKVVICDRIENYCQKDLNLPYAFQHGKMHPDLIAEIDKYKKIKDTSFVERDIYYKIDQ